jgi:hypothetical protein
MVDMLQEVAVDLLVNSPDDLVGVDDQRDVIGPSCAHSQEQEHPHNTGKHSRSHD